MAKTKISQYDATPGNNTDINSINISEGMLPSNVNNSLRQMMADLKKMDVGTDALTSPQLTSVDINGGTIDGAVIGGNSAAAISGTTLALSGNADLNGDLDVDGTTNLDVVDIDGAVNMATTALVTGVLTTTAATVFNGGFAANDGCTITTADNSNQLTLISTDADASAGPVMEFYRNSSSPADSDSTGLIYFTGENDADEKVFYGQIFSQIQDASNGTEDSSIDFITMVAGTGRSRMYLFPTETVFNDASVDLDFRVESNGNANMLLVDGGNNAVGIGTGSPVASGLPNVTIGTRTIVGKVVENQSLFSDNAFYTGSQWTTKETDAWAAIRTNLNSIRLHTGASHTAGDALTAMDATSMRLYISDTEVVFNDVSTDTDFRVESDAQTHMLFVDSSTNRIGIGTETPQQSFSVVMNNAGRVGTFYDKGTNGNSMYNGAAVLGVSRSSNGSTSLNGPIFEVGRDNSLTASYNCDNIFLSVRSDSTVINEQGVNHDFRIESENDSNMFNMDASIDAIGIGIAAQDTVLVYIDAPASHHPMVARSATANTASIVFDNTDAGGARTFASFRISNSEKGAITSTGSVVVYGGTSDYRLKENVVNLTGATDRLKQLRPKRFNFIGDTETIDGFLAHEVDAVVPAAVVGEKDAVDENGEVDAQQMDNGHLVPLLVATIQELEARITALENA